MSADNELVIATFSDCWVVAMQFASSWWDVDTKTEAPETIREFFKDGRIFSTEKDAEYYADLEENSSYYEYGSSFVEFNYPFMM